MGAGPSTSSLPLDNMGSGSVLNRPQGSALSVAPIRHSSSFPLHRDPPPHIPKSPKLLIHATTFDVFGSEVCLQALVDTGAEVKLVNFRKFEALDFHQAQHPVRLGAANSLRLSGGAREATFVLHLQGVTLDSKSPVDLQVPITAYDAEIKYDLILSYGWLAQHNFLVNPRRHGLLMLEEHHAT